MASLPQSVTTPPNGTAKNGYIESIAFELPTEPKSISDDNGIRSQIRFAPHFVIVKLLEVAPKNICPVQ